MSKNKQTQISLIISQAEVLAKQHEVFTDKYVTKANEELYVLLSEIMSVCIQVEASAISDNIINQMRKTLREEHNIKTQKNSRASSIVVRYVVRANRKTAHIYGRVIETAIQNNIQPANLPEFIRSNGGIDAIRKAAAVKETEHEIAELKKKLRKLTEMTLHAAANKPITTLNSNPAMHAELADNYRAQDVQFDYFVGVSGHGKSGYRIVALIPPSKQLEEIALLQLNTVITDDLELRKKDAIEYCTKMGVSADNIACSMKYSEAFSEDEIAEFTNNANAETAGTLQIAA